MMLNSLPMEVTGLKSPIPYVGADGVSEESLRQYGVTHADVVNFYYYVLLSETLSKVDAVVKRTLNIVSIFDFEAKTRPEEQDLFLSGTLSSLVMLVNSQASKLRHTEGLVHPIQEVIQGVASKVLSILNMFSGAAVDFRALLSSPLLSVLNFSLDKKAAYTSSQESLFGDRRVLEKALKLMFKTASKEGSKNVSFTGLITGVTHLWVVSVSVGGKLVVIPHVPKVATLSSGGATRLSNSSKTLNFLPFGATKLKQQKVK